MTSTSITFKSEIDVDVVQFMGGDHMIVHAARVSTKGNVCRENVEDEDDGYGLIRYLMQHRHGTPFEHGGMTFFVNAPIFVWREWHRHRIGFSYNEESARYKQLAPVFYIPSHDRPMFKTDGWKPGRPKFLPILNSVGEAAYNKLCWNLRSSYEVAYASYEENLALGLDLGLARDCLPVGIYSSCWVTCNPRSIMAFLSLRTYDLAAKFVSHPLFEIEQAAKKVEESFQERWPLCHKAFVECGRVAP